MKIVKNLAIIGVGLIGGSLALALKKSNVVAEVWGLGSSNDTLQKAKTLGVIDKIVAYEDLINADVIILASPVTAMFEICEKLAELNLPKDVIFSDVGSTKQSVLQAFQNAFSTIPENLVLAHPIAGRERSGVEAATADLFVNHRVIFTTLENTDYKALGIISSLWYTTGAEVSNMNIKAHDEILAATSHMPHILAYLLVDMLNCDLPHANIFSYAAGGFRDFTRIASSSPRMWRDICVNNAKNIKKLLQTYRTNLEKFEALLDNKDAEQIFNIFERAKKARDSFINREL